MKEPIFKVGDIVTVKKRIGSTSDYRFGFTESMAAYAGRKFTIETVIKNSGFDKPVPDDGCRYYVKENGYSWASSMFKESSSKMVSCIPGSHNNNIDPFIRKKKCPQLDFSL